MNIYYPSHRIFRSQVLSYGILLSNMYRSDDGIVLYAARSLDWILNSRSSWLFRVGMRTDLFQVFNVSDDILELGKNRYCYLEDISPLSILLVNTGISGRSVEGGGHG